MHCILELVSTSSPFPLPPLELCFMVGSESVEHVTNKLMRASISEYNHNLYLVQKARTVNNSNIISSEHNEPILGVVK